MQEEKVITLTEFKVVMEGVDSKLQKIVKVMDFRFGKVDEKFEGVEGKLKKIVEIMDYRFGKVDERFAKVDLKLHDLQEQVGLLHEGQTEIKTELRAGLKDKVADRDFAKLEKRVARLERKTA